MKEPRPLLYEFQQTKHITRKNNLYDIIDMMKHDVFISCREFCDLLITLGSLVPCLFFEGYVPTENSNIIFMRD